ncbi:MAG: phosphotransferase [Ilumatobacter sp.]|jgi:hypothetical protein|uniref:phosphotransferase n=1 Tax=Ilumatobacter sp. TaxID=1967498 RepID=UPI00391AC24A
MVEQRAYVDQRVSDLATATAAAQAAATTWGLSAPTLLRHGMNAIFRSGSHVVRVSTPSVPAERSLELAAVLAEAGIHVPAPSHSEVVRIGGFSVTSWQSIESTGAPIDWSEVGSLVRRVHAMSVDQLPRGLPTPPATVFPWWDFDAMLDRTGGLLDERAREGIVDALERHAGWRDFDHTVVCHGDVHPGNVVMSPDGPVLLDWDLLCLAPRGWDHGPLMTWTDRWGGEAGVYEAFADGYGWSARDDRGAEAFAELRLVAATLMRVAAASLDDAARPEAELRLRFWRGDRSAPMWNAQ